MLDEPAAGLDPRARIQLREMIGALAADGKAVLVSSHILTELAEMCDTVGIIERGHLLAVGSVDEIQKGRQPQRAVQFAFWGAPPPWRAGLPNEAAGRPPAPQCRAARRPQVGETTRESIEISGLEISGETAHFLHDGSEADEAELLRAVRRWPGFAWRPSAVESKAWKTCSCKSPRGACNDDARRRPRPTCRLPAARRRGPSTLRRWQRCRWPGRRSTSHPSTGWPGCRISAAGATAGRGAVTLGAFRAMARARGRIS